MLIINKPRLPPIHLNRPTAAFEPDSAAPRLVLRLQWACFGGLVGRLGLLMIVYVKRVFWEALEEYTTQLLFLNFGIGTVMSTQVCALIFSILIMYILHWHFQVETSCLIKHLSLIVDQ